MSTCIILTCHGELSAASERALTPPLSPTKPEGCQRLVDVRHRRTGSRMDGAREAEELANLSMSTGERRRQQRLLLPNGQSR